MTLYSDYDGIFGEMGCCNWVKPCYNNMDYLHFVMHRNRLIIGEVRDMSSHNKTSGKRKVDIMTCIGWGAAVVAVIVLIVAAFFILGKGMGTAELEGFTPLDQDNLTQGITLDNADVTLDAVGIYTGKYVEDGSDTDIENVPAILVTNHGENMIETGEIQLHLGEKGIAVFEMTDIPAGKSALVLDLNKLDCVEGVTAEYWAEFIKFAEDTSLAEDKFDITGTQGSLTLKNKTDEEYGVVYAYYKNKLTKDIYLGGITYRATFEQIPAQGEEEAEAIHYGSDTSVLTRIKIIE